MFLQLMSLALILQQTSVEGSVVLVDDPKAFGLLSECPPVELKESESFHVREWLVPPDSWEEDFFRKFILDRASGPPTRDEWHECKGDEDGTIQTAARWGYTQLQSGMDRVLLARLSGANTLFVNGDPFPGDAHGRGYEVPVALHKGDNHLYVSGIEGTFDLQFRSANSRMVIDTVDVGYPRISRDVSTWWFQDLTLTFINASTEPADGLHIHYGSAIPSVPRITDWSCWGHKMAPLALYRVGVYFRPWKDRGVTRANSVLMPVAAYSPGDRHASGKLFRIPCRGAAPFGDAAWHVEPAQARRRPGLLNRTSGAIMFVHGTAGSDEDNRDTLGVARYLQERLWYEGSCVPRLWSDTQVEGETPVESVVLFGNEETNGLWGDVLPAGSPIRVRKGELRIGERVLFGDDINVVFACSNPRGYDLAVFVGATGSRGMRSLIPSNALLNDSTENDSTEDDYAAYRVGPDGKPTLIGSGRLR